MHGPRCMGNGKGFWSLFFGYESQSYENKENSGTPYFESKKLELANENKDKVDFRKGFFLF